MTHATCRRLHISPNPAISRIHQISVAPLILGILSVNIHPAIAQSRSTQAISLRAKNREISEPELPAQGMPYDFAHLSKIKRVKADGDVGIKDGFKPEATYGIEWRSRLPSSAIKINLSGLSPIDSPKGKHTFFPQGYETTALPPRGVRPVDIGSNGSNDTLDPSKTPLCLIYIPAAVVKPDPSGAPPAPMGAFARPRTSAVQKPGNDSPKRTEENVGGIYSERTRPFPDIVKDDFPEGSMVLPIRYIERDPINPMDVYVFYDESEVSHKGRIYVGIIAAPSQSAKDERKKSYQKALDTRDTLQKAIDRIQLASSGSAEQVKALVLKLRDDAEEDTTERKSLTEAYEKAARAAANATGATVAAVALAVLDPAWIAAKDQVKELSEPLKDQVLVLDPTPITPQKPEMSRADSGLKINSGVDTTILPAKGAVFPLNPTGDSGTPFLNPPDGPAQTLFQGVGATTKASVKQFQLSSLRVNHLSGIMAPAHRWGRSDLTFDLLISDNNRDINSKIAMEYTPLQRNIINFGYQKEAERDYTVLQRNDGMIWAPQIRLQTSQRYFAVKSDDRDRSRQIVISPFRIQTSFPTGELFHFFGLERLERRRRQTDQDLPSQTTGATTDAGAPKKGSAPSLIPGPLRHGAPRRYDPETFPGSIEFVFEPTQIRHEFTQFRVLGADNANSVKIKQLYLPAMAASVRWHAPFSSSIGAKSFPGVFNLSYSFYHFQRDRTGLLARAVGRDIPALVDFPRFSSNAGLIEISFQFQSNLGIKALGDSNVRFGYRSGLPSTAGFLNPTARNASEFFFGIAQ